MKPVLLIFTALFVFSACGSTLPPTSGPVDIALRELPEKDPMRRDLQKVYSKIQRAKALCAQKIGESGGDRDKLTDILTNCADQASKLRLEVRSLMGWLMDLRYEKAFAAIIKEVRTLIRFYSGARQCVRQSNTQKEFDACITSLTGEINQRF